MRKAIGYLLVASALSLSMGVQAAPNQAVLETDSIIMSDRFELSTMLTPSKWFYGANEDVVMRVSYANLGNTPLLVPAWLFDGNFPDRTFLSVTIDGEDAPYLGAIAKRVALEKQELITLQPGESFTVDYNVSQSFDLSRGGLFEVQFAALTNM